MMSATMRDVAREAGVSVATVSRVFNDSGLVRPETRERILAVVQRLRFAPNSAARSLSTRRTHTVGVLLPDLHGEFFSELLRGLDQLVRQRGFHILVSSSHNERSEVAAALRAMRGRVDGIVVLAPELDVHTLAANVPERVPVILLNSNLRDPSYPSVNIDNYGGALAMTAHLLAGGHRRIALIRGPERNHDAGERLRGFRAALAGGGVEWDETLLVAGDFTERAGHEAALRLLTLDPWPTAIFAANDAMAVGALSALREAGVRVPEDMAVVGFDDVPIARYMTPALTTVRAMNGDLGAQAALRLFQWLDARPPVATHETLPTELAVRQSCGLLPLRNPETKEV
jgi:LacI family transcriptional regulator